MSEEEGRDGKDFQCDMPPLDSGGDLVGKLFDVGPVVNTGMGAVALRSEHLIAWQQETGVRLQLWESRFLRRLSNEYLAESQRAEKLGCEPPWTPPDHKREPSALQMSLRALAA